MNHLLTTQDMERYQRQIALPEITPQQQRRLKNTHVFLAGAGGLGAAVLPYLAGAGIGHITIADHDTVSLVNLHRQVIFTHDDIGFSKAQRAASYGARLNSLITLTPLSEKITAQNAAQLTQACDLIIDGTDNFETKNTLNNASIEHNIPLLSASVEQWSAQVGIFAGADHNAPCYRCLFPDLPLRARNCNEAGILGTAAGLAGLYQAHMALCYLLALDNAQPGAILSLDFKTLRLARLTLEKSRTCSYCSEHATNQKQERNLMERPIELIHPKHLHNDSVIIVDVRTAEEVRMKPIPGALHMELSTLPQRFQELPLDKRLAFACAANVRSAQAASFMQAMGHSDVCIYDVLAQKQP